MVEIGDGGTVNNQYLPSYDYYNYNFTQQIYTAEEVGMSGNIVSIAFKNTSTGTEKTRTFNIYLTQTEKDSFEGSTDWVPISEYDLVYSGAVTITVGEWTTIDFDTPFYYDGNSNLLVSVADVTGSWSSSPHVACLTFGGPSQSIYAHRDASAYNIADPGVTGTVLQVKNQIVLGINPAGESGPTCLRVTSLSAADITSNSVTLNWTDNNTTGGTYAVFGRNMGEDGDDVLLGDGIATTSYTITGLESNTDYSFYVVAYCSADLYSNPTNVTVRTTCGDEAFPFSENFDVSLANDPCWGGNNSVTVEQVFEGLELTIGANNSWTYSDATSNGLEAGHYRANIYGTGCKKWMITPSIDLTQAVAPMLTFDAAFTVYSNSSNAPAAGFENNSSQAFMVLVSTDGGATWPAENAVMWMNEGGQHTLAELASSNYVMQMVDLSQYVGQTVRIAFYAQSIVSGGDNNIHIDNIAVRTAPNCMPVGGLAVGNITAESATLTWESEASHYNVYLIVDGEAALYDSTDNNSVTLTGLNAMSQYNFGVTAVCGEEESFMSNISFRTACSAVEVPYSWNFDDENSGSTPECWNKVGDGLAAVTTGAGNSYSPDNYVRFSGATSNIVVLPQTTDEISGLQLRFWTRPESCTNNGCGSFSVGYMTDDTTFVEVANYDRTEWGSNDYEQKFVFFTDAPVGARMAMRHNANSVNWYWFVDDVTVEVAPECGEPVVYSEDAVACNSYTWAVNNKTYDASGHYTSSLPYENGCDSVVYALNLTINQSTNTIDTVAAVESYEWNGTVYYESGVYSYTYIDDNNCESMMTLDLTIAPPAIECANGFCDITIYAQDSYGDGWNGNIINIVQNDNVFNYTMSAGSYDTATVSVCASEPLSFGWTAGSWSYETSFTIVNANGNVAHVNNGSALATGDVFFTMDNCGAETVCETAYTNDTVEVCDGYTWHNRDFYDSGIIVDTTIDAMGCITEIATLNLIILGNTVYNDIYDTATDSYTWNEETYTQSGVYSASYTVDNGCDSVVTLHLSLFMTGVDVPYSTGFEANDDVAWMFANGPNGWLIGGDSSAASQSLYISNDGFNNMYTITTSSNSYAYKAFDLQPIAYEVSYDWVANGESNYDYLRVFVVPSNVAFNSDNTNGISTTGAPDGWIALDGGTKLNQTTEWTSESHLFIPEEAGSYYIVFYWHNDMSLGSMPPASVDNFSIAPADTTCETEYITEEEQGCDNYTWYDTTYSESGVYTHEVYNELGCLTQVLTLNLTINNSVETSTSDTAVGSYTINDVTFTRSGTTSVAFTAANGCDSIVSFHWVVLPDITCEEGDVATVANADNSSSSQQYMPAYSWYNYSYSEVIVPAERLVGIGTVKAMEFKPATMNTGSSYFTNCKIYMANTDRENLSDGFIQDTNLMQLVWSGDMNFTSLDWQTLLFSNNFEWDGVSNVVVAVHRSHGTYSQAPLFESYYADGEIGRYVYNDGSPYIMGEITGGTATNNVPLYNFIGCEGNTAFCFPVQNLVVTDVTYSSVTLSWEDNRNTDATSYDIYQGESIMATVSGTSYTVNNLNPLTDYTFRVVTNCSPEQDPHSAIVNVTTPMYCENGNCTVGIVAADSYGDGWNGHAINVIMDGDTVDTYTLAGGHNGSATIDVCAGQPISFSGISGQYTNEVSFDITNADGIPVYSGVGSDLTADGVFFTMESCTYMPDYDSVMYEDSSCDSYYWEMTGETYYASGSYIYVSDYTLYILNLTIYPCVVNVSVMANDATLGNVYGGGVFNYGDTVMVVAIPEVGSQFNGWNISGSNPLVFAATDNITVTANFSVGGAIIHDTTTVVETITDTVTITESIIEYVHDTVVETVVDTVTMVEVVTDTVTLVETVIDTVTLVEIVIDTVTLVETVTDTVTMVETVIDTVTLVETVTDTVTVVETEYVEVPIHDTTVVTLTDTVTMIETVTDTVTLVETVTDTVTVVETVIDTVTNTEYIYDTTVVTETDTLYLTISDTVYIPLYDTIYITVHDTVYITEQGIPGTDEGTEAKIYSSQGQIVVEGAEGNEVRLYDVVGRVLASKRDEYAPLRFDAPASGTYMIKIGSHPARRVVVIK